jgi:polyphosphate kinase
MFSSASAYEPKDAMAGPQLLDRDHSTLAFNLRVLDWACRKEVPALERLRYLCIVSSNLDEFFEVRVEPQRALDADATRVSQPDASFGALASAVHALVARQYSLYNDELMPLFEKHGIRIISHGDRNPAQRRWVKQYFEREVRPLLLPVGLDPSHPFPLVANKSLNFIVRLSGADAFGRANDSRASGRIVSRPRSGPVLAVSRHPALGPGSR